MTPPRLPDEPSRWYSRLDIYCRMPPATRTLEGAWKRSLVASGSKRSIVSSRAPGSWYRAAGRFRWAERAAALDSASLERADIEIETDRQQRREQRRRVSAKLLEAAEALLRDGSVTANPLAVSRSVQIALQESRLEHGGTETDAPDLAPAMTPTLKLVFEPSKLDSPSVYEVTAEEAEAELAEAATAAIREPQPTAALQQSRHNGGFVFRRS